MKKKTSLWISGITTVAMRAVAVGSFAAWQTLSKTENFTATAEDPTTVSVTAENSEFINTNVLAPTGVDTGWVADGKTQKDTLSVEVTPKLEGSAPSSAKLTYTLAGNLGSETDSTNFNKYFDVKLYDSTGGTEITADEVTSGTKYKVKVAFKTGYDTSASASWDKNAVDEVKGQNIKVYMVVKAEK